MSIRSAVGNITSSVGNDIQTIFSSASTNIQNIVGTAVTGFSNLWSGGFAGIDENNFSVIKSSLENYCSTIEEHIAQFDQASKLEIAYKGAIQDAADDFVKAVKELLQAYVSNMRRNIMEADAAFQNYKEAAQQIAQDVHSDAQTIRQDAQKIRLDEVNTRS